VTTHSDGPCQCWSRLNPAWTPRPIYRFDGTRDAYPGLAPERAQIHCTQSRSKHAVQRLSSSSVEGLRSIVRPDYAGMGAADLEQVVDSSMAGLPADVAENFLNTLGSLGKTAAPVLQRLGPGVAQGAVSGATVGGPWGALIGAGAGLASGLLGGQAKPPRPAAAAATGTPPAAPSPATPPAPQSLPTGQAAAGTLLGLLQNPTIQQALLSQVLGASGAQQVATPSGVSVPRAAINSLLTQLLANATEGLAESEAITEQSYLQGADGEYLLDPASIEQQAALVLSHVTQPLAESGADESWSNFDAHLEAVEFY
jgi:hypothetical protein